MNWQPPESAQTDLDVASIETDGYLVLEGLLAQDELAEVDRLLEPLLAADLHGRNDFEGHRTQRVYALVSRGQIFEDLVRHPRVMAICDRLLQPGYLLTASQAICIHPGESPQPLHYDDTFYPLPRPRPAISISTIWAVDAFTRENGATEVIPGSHRWSDAELSDVYDTPSIGTLDFATQRDGQPVAASEWPYAPELRDQLRAVEMPAGSCVVFAGTLLHRGGAGHGAGRRLAFSNQYCEPWARQQENFTLGIAPEKVLAMDEQVRRLLGFSIHPPFMGHFGGLHPERIIDPDARKPQ